MRWLPNIAMNTTKRSVIALCILSFILLMNQMTNSLIVYISASYPGYKTTSIMTLPGLVGLFAVLALGPMALKVSSKLLLIICGTSMAVYFIIFSLVGANGPFLWLIVASCIVGIAQGCALTLVSSAISEYIGVEKSAVYVAITNSIMYAGSAFMSVLGGKIASGNGGADWPKAYYIGLLCIPVMIAFAVIMPWHSEKQSDTAENDDSHREAAAPEKKGISARLVLIILTTFLWTTCCMAFLYNVSDYVVNTYKLGTSAQAGLVSSLYTGGSFAIGLLYPACAKRIGTWVATVGYVIFTMGLVFMTCVTGTLAGAMLGAAMIGLGFNMILPYVVGAAMEETSARYIPITMTVLMGGVNLFMYLAPYIYQFFGNFLGGGVHGSLLFALLCAAGLTVISVFLYALKKPRQA